MELFRNPMQPIIRELWFDMFCFVINVEMIDFFYIKRPTDYNPNYFWMIPVEDWSKTTPATVLRLLETLNYSNVLDIDVLLVKKLKNRCCVFDDQRINLAENGKI